jgi:hypothetical protein
MSSASHVLVEEGLKDDDLVARFDKGHKGTQHALKHSVSKWETLGQGREYIEFTHLH